MQFLTQLVALIGHKLSSTPTLSNPSTCLVMCDGMPDGRQSALDAGVLCVVPSNVSSMPCISAPPDSEGAIEFMKELASVGHGRYSAYDLSQSSHFYDPKESRLYWLCPVRRRDINFNMENLKIEVSGPPKSGKDTTNRTASHNSTWV